MPNADLMPDIVSLLILALGPLGAGKVVQELVNRLADAAPDPLSSDQKFYLAILVSFVVPLAAYGLLVWLGGAPFDLATLVWEIGVGYMVSQGYHRDAKKQKAARRGVPLAVVPAAEPSNNTEVLTGPAELPEPQTHPLDPPGDNSTRVR
jgi:hypothetical protein